MCTLSSGVWPGGRQAEFCQLLPPDFAVLPAVVLVTRYRSLMSCLSYIQSNIETALALSVAPTRSPRGEVLQPCRSTALDSSRPKFRYKPLEHASNLGMIPPWAGRKRESLASQKAKPIMSLHWSEASCSAAAFLAPSSARVFHSRGIFQNWIARPMA